MVEIQAHGGFAVADTILTLLKRRGARFADPGEFTRRAFLNGRIDLVQAESVMEVVSADTREQLRQSERMLDGRFSVSIHDILELIIDANALLTMNIDFSDHLHEDLHLSNLRIPLHICRSKIDSLLRTTEIVRRLRNGITVVLTGPVNSGKSSLFNTLLGRKRSLVNAKPGTTRDWIEERIDLDGFPVNIIDTAGMRDTSDEIEREGVSESIRPR